MYELFPNSMCLSMDKENNKWMDFIHFMSWKNCFSDLIKLNSIINQLKGLSLFNNKKSRKINNKSLKNMKKILNQSKKYPFLKKFLSSWKLKIKNSKRLMKKKHKGMKKILNKKKSRNKITKIIKKKKKKWKRMRIQSKKKQIIKKLQ